MTTATTRIIPGAFYDNSGMVKNAKHPAFGAVGNGTTDDTVALQACLTASLTKGDVCVIPPGDYKVTAPLIPPGSNAFMNSSKHRIIMHGARLFSYDATAGRDVLALSSYIGQEGSLTIEGGTIDGANATGTTNGVAMHSVNTVLNGTVIRNCAGTGVRFVNDLAVPPICCSIVHCLIQKNGIGVWSAVSTSNLVLLGNRIEGNSGDGVLLDSCGKATLIGNTIENNGFVTTTKSNLHIVGGVMFHVASNHFESNPYQGHSSVLIEGGAVPTYGGCFIGNIVTGYYETSLASGVALTASIGLDISGGGAGAVESVISHGNLFAGQYIGVRINTNARGFAIGPDDFSDNFAPSFVTPACTRYSIVSANPGIVYDLNRYAGLVTNVGLTAGPGSFSTLNAAGLITAVGGIKMTGGTTVVGSFVKHATFGLLGQAVAGSTYDAGFVNPGGGTSIWAVPTGTVDMQMFGHVKAMTAGKGLFVKEGTNARMGVSTLVAGTVVVSTTAVAANSRILLTNQAVGGTAGFLVVSARTAGTSFTILSSNAADTSSIAWLILEPA